MGELLNGWVVGLQTANSAKESRESRNLNKCIFYSTWLFKPVNVSTRHYISLDNALTICIWSLFGSSSQGHVLGRSQRAVGAVSG